MKKWETKRLSAFRKNWRAAGNFSKSYFCSFLQWLQINGGSDQFENFFAFAEHVLLRAEPLYYDVKISASEKKFVNMNLLCTILTFKNFLEFLEKFLISFYLNRFGPEREVLRMQSTLKNSIPIIRTEDITAKSFFC